MGCWPLLQLTLGAGNIAACLKKIPLYLIQSEPLTGDTHTFQVWQESQALGSREDLNHTQLSVQNRWRTFQLYNL